ncbi:MAG TPA: PIN domain-containing protein [Thermoanaerobaculia bacterium]|nr:PIN domain-containing protein [Thermoanaerobaculia bacterium]
MSFVVAVVDTSVLIDHVNGRGIRALDEAIANELLIVPPLVISELVSGATRGNETIAIAELIRSLTIHETDIRHWIAVGDLRRDLASHGVNLTIPDAHVAQCAIDLDATLFTRDKVFNLVSQYVPLRFA